jgi:hypothetical protein
MAERTVRYLDRYYHLRYIYQIEKEESIYMPPPRVGTVPNASSSGPVALPKNMCVPVALLHIFVVRATSRLTL